MDTKRPKKPSLKTLLVTTLLILCVVAPTDTAIAQNNPPVDGTQTIYSIYPGDIDLLSKVVSNKDGVDGKGLHYFYNSAASYTIPGIDTWNDGKIYAPATFCPSQGDILQTVDDTVGQGGHGILMQHSISKAKGLKIMIWHLEKASELFIQRASAGECVYATELIGYEGESTTSQGNITTFSLAMPDIPPHSHTSVGKTTPWNNGCFEVPMNEYYWVNLGCVAIKWISTGNIGSTNTSAHTQNNSVSNLSALIQSMFFTPKGAEAIQTDYQYNEKPQIPLTIVVGLVLVGLLLYWIVHRLQT